MKTNIDALVGDLLVMQDRVARGELAQTVVTEAVKEFAADASVEDLAAFFSALCRRSPTMTEHDVVDMIEAEKNRPTRH